MWSWSLFLVVRLVSLTIADDSNLFIYPTAPGPSNNFVADLAFQIGSTQTIQWSTTLDSYEIALYHQSIAQQSGGQVEIIYQTQNGAGSDMSFSWDVDTYGQDTSESSVFFLWLNPGPNGFTCHYFNITNNAQSTASSSSSPSSSSSSVSSSSTSSSTTSSVASSTSSTPSSTTNTSTNAPFSTSSFTSSGQSSSTITGATAAKSDIPSETAVADNGTSTTLKVGLGVGIGVGVPLILLFGVWLGMKAVKQRRSTNGQMYNHQYDHDYRDPEPAWKAAPPVYGQHEMSATEPNPKAYHEVHGDTRSPVELDSRS